MSNEDTNTAIIKFQNGFNSEEDRTVFVDNPSVQLNGDATVVPLIISNSNTFMPHKFSFTAPEGAATTIKIVNTAQTSTFASDPLYVSAPSLFWAGSPGPTADASIEFGSPSNEPVAVTKLVVSPVAGRDSCGQVQLERCGDWDFADKSCAQYHTVATFDQGSEYELPDKIALESQRWRISPLTTLPVYGAGYYCDGVAVSENTDTARACEAKCREQGIENCGYFSFSSQESGVNRCK